MAKFNHLTKDYENALQQLESAMSRDNHDDLERAGCIQYFEFCFELAWKTLQAYFTEQGLHDVASPRGCLKQAFKMGLIQDETLWLQMLTDRNLSTHTYDLEVSLSVYGRLQNHVTELRHLLVKLRTLS